MTNLDAALYVQQETMTDSPNFNFNFTVADLYQRNGLVRLDKLFLDFLHTGDETLYDKLSHARAHPDALLPKDESALLIDIAPWLEDFLARLFNIENEVQQLAARHHELAPLYFCKRQFVQRRARGKISDEELASIDGLALEKELTAEFGEPFTELMFATKVAQWMEAEADNELRLNKALQYAAWALRTPEGQRHTHQGILFKSPAKLDFQHLLSLETDNSAGYTVHRLNHVRERDGFALTDHGTDLMGALDEANYCIWCHEQGKDSCSKGMIQKPKSPDEPQIGRAHV